MFYRLISREHTCTLGQIDTHTHTHTHIPSPLPPSHTPHAHTQHNYKLTVTHTRTLTLSSPRSRASAYLCQWSWYSLCSLETWSSVLSTCDMYTSRNVNHYKWEKSECITTLQQHVKYTTHRLLANCGIL